ncbi:MAG: leucine-rich repeat domain-containing protein [Mycoplasmataceae bacterium]|nr:leucine-rich repeat domain-containing protein [Mycoplasmataceae bacterium]
MTTADYTVSQGGEYNKVLTIHNINTSGAAVPIEGNIISATDQEGDSVIVTDSISCVAATSGAINGSDWGDDVDGELKNYYKDEATNTVTYYVDFTSNYEAANLVIPATVTDGGKTYSVRIGPMAFGNPTYQNNYLTGSLTISDGVSYIGEAAFIGQAGLTGLLTIGSSVTFIGGSAFMKCSNLTGDIEIPDSVTEIGESAFEDCEDFGGTLTIGNSVTSIGDNAFKGCDSLIGDIEIPNGVTEIHDSTFEDCGSFNGTLTIGNSVTSIGENAFKSCYGLTGNLVIPNSVVSIGVQAFYNCINLGSTEEKSLTIGSGVTSLGYQAFFGTGFVKTAPTSLQDGKICKDERGVYYLKNGSTYYCFGKAANVTNSGDFPSGTIAIEQGTKFICDKAFDGCSAVGGSFINPRWCYLNRRVRICKLFWLHNNRRKPHNPR